MNYKEYLSKGSVDKILNVDDIKYIYEEYIKVAKEIRIMRGDKARLTIKDVNIKDFIVTDKSVLIEVQGDIKNKPNESKLKNVLYLIKDNREYICLNILKSESRTYDLDNRFTIEHSHIDNKDNFIVVDFYY